MPVEYVSPARQVEHNPFLDLVNDVFGTMTHGSDDVHPGQEGVWEKQHEYGHLQKGFVMPSYDAKQNGGRRLFKKDDVPSSDDSGTDSGAKAPTAKFDFDRTASGTAASTNGPVVHSGIAEAYINEKYHGLTSTPGLKRQSTARLSAPKMPTAEDNLI